MNVWNALDVSTYGLQAAIVCMHLGRLGQGTTWLSVFSALQCILLLFRLQYFSRVFKSTRFAFLEACEARRCGKDGKEAPLRGDRPEVVGLVAGQCHSRAAAGRVKCCNTLQS